MALQPLPHWRPWSIFLSFWTHRALVVQLAKREVVKRYRGSALGLVWAMAYPLMILVIYTFVFRVIFKAQWQQEGSHVDYALILFAGLIVYNFFSECLGAAPALLQNHQSYVKKVVFPLEILPWVLIGNALFHAVVSVLVLIAGLLVIQKELPWTLIFLPVVWVPLLLLTIGFTWIVSSLSVYLRDIGQVVSVGLVLLMFVSPILYPVSAIPESIEPYAFLNPLTPILVQARQVAVFGEMPSPVMWIAMMAVTWLFAWAGLIWFQKTRAGFADVL